MRNYASPTAQLITSLRSQERRFSISCTKNSKMNQGDKGSYQADKHKAFEDLQLHKMIYDVPIGRVRQHVNPLSARYQVKSEPLKWTEVFSDPGLPLIVDVGTGYGRFPLLSAIKGPQNINYLGTDIRHPIVGRANFWTKELGVSDRVYFTFTNITISLQNLLHGYPGNVSGIYIQFPDPTFKKRREKRHIVQPEFVHACSNVLSLGGTVFMQSDVESCAVYTRNMFDHYAFEHFVPHSLHKRIHRDQQNDNLFRGKELNWANLSWLEENPIGFPTEREVYSMDQALNIYRTLLVRT